MEEVEYNQIQNKIETNALQPVVKKDPEMAGVLNLLPGVGNLYLKQWGPFLGNLLLWPISPVWGVPQAYIDANTINKQETLVYYKVGAGKDLLLARENTKMNNNN